MDFPKDVNEKWMDEGAKERIRISATNFTALGLSVSHTEAGKQTEGVR
jgi:hypothetical protein